MEATHAEAFTAMRQRILANNSATLVEAAQDRAEAEAAQQAHVEWDLRHRLAHT